MVLVIIFVVYLARGILTPFVLAGLLALALGPLIGVLQRRLRFRRGFAVAAAYLLLAGVLVAIPLVFIPALARSAGALDLTQIAESLTEWVVSILESLRTFTLFGATFDLSSTLDPLIEQLQSDEGFEFDFEQLFGGAWAVTSAIFTSVLGFLTTSLLALVLSIYISSSVHGESRSGVYGLVPAQYQPEVRILGARIARVWTDYLRGQLTVALVVGAMTTVIMFALGMPGALIIGVIGGLLNIVPTFGPIFASVVAALVALVQGSYRLNVSNLVFALIVVGAYTVIQQLESSVITPRILGGAMSVSPIAVLLGILIGFSAAGILGAIVAVPVVATGKVVFNYAQAKLVDRDPFPDGMPPPKRTVKDRIDRLRNVVNGNSDEDVTDEDKEGADAV
jgi:predicted PurR-regulated permease PerM